MFGLYSHAPGYIDSSSPVLDNWPLGQSPSDPLHYLAQTLFIFCFPNPPPLPHHGSSENSAYEKLKLILTGDNLKAFLHEYRHYHSHWPLIHTPTFDPLSANHGLVLAMCCVGAVYSDRLGPADVRWLMELVRMCVLRSSQVYRLVQNPHQMLDLTQNQSATTEEMQALALLHSLLVWHGSQKQRQLGREEFWALANVTRRVGLLQPFPLDNPNASALHLPGPITGDEVNSWNWTSWIENEKRSRLMGYIFLIDASSTIFFNTQPQFDVHEIRVPLPADDAAWEAKSAEECASALGLRGEASQVMNESGSRRAKQLGMSEALQVLYTAGQGHFPERATNVFGKFSKFDDLFCMCRILTVAPVLIHAIHIQIYNIQRRILRRVSSSGTSTPQSRRGSASNPTSGVSEQAQHLLRSTVSALEFWKTCWDIDLTVQFKPHQRRWGFCRDGVHFYYLAQVFLRKSRSEEWAAPADLRCRHVFNLLKQIRSHVASDSAQKGIETGSLTMIGDDYGISDITLNMRSLFTPLEDK